MAGAPHLEAFLDAAKYFIGLKESGNNTFTDPRGREMLSLYGNTNYCSAWCAVFVSACAQKAGIAGTVIKKQSAAGWLQESTVLYCNGQWIDGPYINGGKAVTPLPGDIISFGNSGYHGHGHATHVGIVEYVEDGKVHTIEGNTSDQCKRKEYSLSYSAINCYVRPDWSKVGDDISAYLAKAGQLTIGPLYQNRNDRHDMTLRQVGYLNANYELSNNVSGLAVSVINYTSVLGDIYDLLAPATLNSIQVDTSNLTGNYKIAMDYLLKVGFSASSASALVGCMQTYSLVTPSYYKQLINKKVLRGLCAWEEDKIKILKSRLSNDWMRDLSGQLEFFTYDLETNYPTLLVLIKTQPLDITSIATVVIRFQSIYGNHFKAEKYIEESKANALEIYNKLIITQTQIVGGVSNLKDQNGNALSAKYSVPIPNSVSQTGIIDDYTSYSAWYTRWHKSSPQRKLAEMWKNQGYPCDKGVATIGGYYCVAVRPKFGKCGEVIVITLEGNKSFSAIICDEKGEDAGSEWGHKKGNGRISLIEWERVKTRNGKVVTGTSFTDVDKNGFGDWYGKKVINITNYGKYADVKWT